MKDENKNNLKALNYEVELLKKLYYKSKNQHKSSIVLNKMNEVRKLGMRFLFKPTQCLKDKLKQRCMDLYIAASNGFVLGHFVKFSLLIFGISSRIYFLSSKITIKKVNLNEIDQIFFQL